MDHDAARLTKTGCLTAHFWVTPEGKVTNIHMIGEAGGKQDLADATASAITAAVISPIPKELSAALPKKGLEVEYKFDLY